MSEQSTDLWRWHVPDDPECSCDGCLGDEPVEVVYRGTLREDVVEALVEGVAVDQLEQLRYFEVGGR